jgi:hypothetical protein
LLFGIGQPLEEVVKLVEHSNQLLLVGVIPEAQGARPGASGLA